MQAFPTAARLGLLAALLGMHCGAALAQWQWRDERGQMQFSDLPPPRSVPDRSILQRPAVIARAIPSAAASAPDEAPSPGKLIDPALEARRRQLEQQQTAQRQADESAAAQRKLQQQALNCDRARVQMRTLESGDRLTRTNARGEREFLDDAGRAAELAYARQVAASECR